MGFDQGFINTTQKMGQRSHRASYSLKNTNDELKKEFFERVEKQLQFLEGENVVSIARMRERNSQEARKDNSLFFQALLYDLEPLRKAGWFFSLSPRFEHAAKFQVIQKSSIEGFGYSQTKARAIDIQNTDSKNSINQQRIFTEQMSCSIFPRLEVQLTYKGTSEIGIPEVNVYVFDTSNIQSSMSKDFINIKTYDDLYSMHVGTFGEPVAHSVTNEFGYANLGNLCDHEKRKTSFIIVALVKEYQEKVKQLDSLYYQLQKELALVCRSYWMQQKPKWNVEDFLELKNKKYLNWLVGIGEGAWAYKTLAYDLFLGIDKKITGYIDETEKNIKNGKLKDVLPDKEAQDIITRVKEQHAFASLILSDEALVFFIFKSIYLHIVMNADEEFRDAVQKFMPKIFYQLVIATIILLGAQRYLGTVPYAVKAIAYYNIASLIYNTGKTAIKINNLSQDLDKFMTPILAHLDRAKKMNDQLRAHGHNLAHNQRNVFTLSPWKLLSDSLSQNINVPNQIG